jgi:hypothetical protein
MGIIRSIAITSFENLGHNQFETTTRLKVTFNVDFINESQVIPSRSSDLFHNRFGFKVQVLGYPDPNARIREGQEIFDFERMVYRWVATGGNIITGGIFGGRLEVVTTKVYNLTPSPVHSGVLGIDTISYYGQSAESQEIELSLLDINPAIATRLPRYFGGGTFYSKQIDHIFARLQIVERANENVIGSVDSAVLRGYFGTVEG